MDAISLLLDDHVVIDRLFDRYSSATTLRQKRAIADELVTAMTVHTWLEERLLCAPAAEANQALMHNVLDEVADHQQLRAYLADLAYACVSSAPTEQREANLDAAIATLRDTNQAHVEVEEGSLFPELANVLGPAELERLGAELQIEREGAPTRPFGWFTRGVERGLEIARGVAHGSWVLTRGLLTHLS